MQPCNVAGLSFLRVHVSSIRKGQFYTTIVNLLLMFCCAPCSVV